jgi:hypothetical protein
VLPQRFQSRLYETVLTSAHFPASCAEELLAKEESMKRFALIGALLIVFASAVLYADTLMIDFEASHGYSPGSIQGQNGWGGQNPPGIPINLLIDQTIVTNGVSAPASFGAQSWRISNAYTSGSFGDMPFSPSLVNEAGETQALNGNGVFTFSGGTRQNHFEAQWAFASTDPLGPETDSYVSVSPDRGDGARMGVGNRTAVHSDKRLLGSGT